jgi:hypothetical protein
LASGGFYQLGYPGLGVDEGVAPLFAVDDWGLGALGAAMAGGFYGGLHLGDEGFGFGLGVDVRGDESDVFIDVGERVRGESEYGKAGFEDGGQ